MVNPLFLPDIDECAGEHDCNVLADCADTEGSYTCTCNTGYTGDGKSSCVGKYGLFSHCPAVDTAVL